MRNTNDPRDNSVFSKKRPPTCFLVLVVGLLLTTGCASYHAQKVGPTSIMHAQSEIPEEELLDVGITVFAQGELTEEEANKQKTHPEIRKAESHYIPYHLKNTLQQSSQWGAVRVSPRDNGASDVVVNGEIIESHGQRLALKVVVTDAAGNVWLEKAYKADATETAYEGNVIGEKDAFQDLYNTIANDMADFRQQLKPADLREIRTIAKLKFAENFAPDAFNDYLRKEDGDKTTISRLPSDDDPMMERVLRIRERDYMFVDTLNGYYEVFYERMWPDYEDWRKANLTEQVAIRKIKRSAYTRQALGALLIALAFALDAGNIDNTAALRGAMVIVGGQVTIDGFNVSKQAEIHSAAIQELAESFGSDMKPVVLEFQGKKYELTGSAEEQYAQWRALLRKIYFAETGFEPGKVTNETPMEPEKQ